ncbi:hypothetical protein DFA_04201 [Cavenderia fasciculata]|uniref:Transmembrane protein n=1 Tax=Cavenderia fasciculata TaxID=261658 RepID=F4Q1K4_CACFS|nr:uncharacterized protein DFA_04201 [Cavenderia fasciculata]EGG18705.1 hypothetical protein DFA_04201 [Cavenderia fasciculata]|eukprot:XP_004366609.1 hypothetical protein DFA_04201 [Cavenderia fasciculata]
MKRLNLIVFVVFVFLWIGYYIELKESIELFYDLVPPSKLLYFIKHPNTITTEVSPNALASDIYNLLSIWLIQVLTIISSIYCLISYRFLFVRSGHGQSAEWWEHAPLLSSSNIDVNITYIRRRVRFAYSLLPLCQLPPSKLLYFIQHPETIAKEFGRDTPVSLIYYITANWLIQVLATISSIYCLASYRFARLCYKSDEWWECAPILSNNINITYNRKRVRLAYSLFLLCQVLAFFCSRETITSCQRRQPPSPDLLTYYCGHMLSGLGIQQRPTIINLK